MKKQFLIALAGIFAIGASSFAETNTFDHASVLDDMKVKGFVSVDAGRFHSAPASLKLRSKAKVVMNLFEEDEAGKVDFWVYEDGAVASGPKIGGAGAMWGVEQSDGQMLVVGAIYAPYIDGDEYYSATVYNPKGRPGTVNRPYFTVQYLKIRRKKGWHRWTFDFTESPAIQIRHNDRAVGKFDASGLEPIAAFKNLVLFGDTTDSKQVVRVDDVSFTAK